VTGHPDRTTDVLLAHSYFLLYDPKQVRKMRPYPPLATLITASVLRGLGLEVGLFDAMLSPGVEEFVERVERERPPVVAILEDNFNFLTKMCTTRMRDAAFEMIRTARSCGSFVVVNGSDMSDVPQQYLEAGAHAVIIGETEITLPRILEARDRARPLTEVRGLVLEGRNEHDPDEASAELVRTPPRPFVQDLESLPLPAWDLIDVERYREAWVEAHGRLSWNMVTTRGCPYGCNWCAKPLYGQRYAQRKAEAVADELAKLVAEVNPDHVWFGDDIFGLTPRWIEDFASALEARSVRVPFTIQTRPDLIKESASTALARAGCEEAWIGVESGAQSVLDAMDKRTKIDDIRRVTRLLERAGVRPSWFLQLGYPGEDWPEILSTRDLVREEAPWDVGVSVSYPLPGTAFHERVAEELSEKTNWTDSNDLAMLFNGTFTTAFYRLVRDLLHDEAVVARLEDDDDRADRLAILDRRWQKLGEDLERHRSSDPTSLGRSAAS
jgi:anaerobic magnesium-protoporphyrin IX monomethyl ester cyclase